MHKPQNKKKLIWYWQVNLEKMLRFFLLVNKQGQTRFSRYYNTQLQSEERVLMEADISRKCLKRGESQVRIINF